jgi:hypothetical protein
VNSSSKPWSLPRPFEQIQFIRGTENVFLDLAEDRSEFTIAAIYPDLVEIGLDAVNSQ